MRRVIIKRGFTLIELLVVIAIIALLLSVLIPALNIVKMHATGVVCLSNLGGMSKGWLLYSDDNDGTVCGGTVGNTGDPTNSWVQFPDGNVSDEMSEKERCIEIGSLFPYIEAIGAYHCPGDRRYLSPSIDPGAYGLEIGGYRSYSIVGGMRGVNPGGGWQIIPIQKLSDLKSPGSKYIYVEEADGRGTNAGSWVINPRTREWVDPFAIWHNERSTLGFADGHGEKHQWVDESTIRWSETQDPYNPLPAGAPTNDLDYMISAYPYARLQ